MKRLALIITVGLVACLLCSPLYGQTDAKAKLKAMKPKDFPVQPIEVIVVYPAGGTMDLAARVLAKYLEEYTENRCIVINKTGGGGLIGHTFVATQAKNDGYTIAVLSSGFVQHGLLSAKGSWSIENVDAMAFLNIDNVFWWISTSGSLKNKSGKDVLTIAKEKPNELKIGIVPEMTFQFLLEDVEMTSGAKFISVPFQGSPPSLVAVLGGHVDIATAFLGESRGHLEAGKIRPVAAAGIERSFYLKDVPTFNEILGESHINWATWRFVAAPKGMPRDRFRYLEAAIDAALHDTKCIEDFEKAGMKVGLKYTNAAKTEEDLRKLSDEYKAFFTRTGRITK